MLSWEFVAIPFGALFLIIRCLLHYHLRQVSLTTVDRYPIYRSFCKLDFPNLIIDVEFNSQEEKINSVNKSVVYLQVLPKYLTTNYTKHIFAVLLFSFLCAVYLSESN